MQFKGIVNINSKDLSGIYQTLEGNLRERERECEQERDRHID